MADKTSSEQNQATTNSNAEGEVPASRPGRRRVLRKVLLAALLVITAGGGTVFWLLRSEPAHWKQHQQFLQSVSPQELKAMTRKVDRQMELLVTLSEELDQASDSQADKPLVQKVHVAIEEANVWITEKVEEWLKYRDYDMPSEVTSPMIAMEDGQLLLSFRFDTATFSQIFTAGFDVEFLENGNALLRLQNVSAGRLPLPVDGIGDYIRSKAPDNETARKAAGWLDKLDGVEFKPSLKAGKRHKACIVDYEVTEDGITLTVRVAPRPGYAPRKPTPPQIAAASE